MKLTEEELAELAGVITKARRADGATRATIACEAFLHLNCLRQDPGMKNATDIMESHHDLDKVVEVVARAVSQMTIEVDHGSSEYIAACVSKVFCDTFGVELGKLKDCDRSRKWRM